MAVLSFEQWPFPAGTTAAIVLVTFYLALYRLQMLKKHHDEPPIIPSAVPFLGPLLGMVLYGGKHIKTIGFASFASLLSVKFAI
jgi:hypothetical protein